MASAAEGFAEHADYVIVGGGTSGLVVANRLTEDPNVTVLVLEAGQNHLEDPRVNIPAFWNSLVGSDLDWQFRSINQPGLGDRAMKLPSGKLLGGSSGLNGQTLVAPSQAGIDAWAEMGNPGWDWAALQPYYRKFYTLHLPDNETRQHLGLDWVDAQIEGASGPIQTSFTGVLDNPLPSAWVKTFAGLHAAAAMDPFTGKGTGAYSNMSTVDPNSKTRSYAANAYAAPVMSRPNLKIIYGAEVRKLTLDSASPSVTVKGVEAVVADQPQSFGAQKEVILAAGVFQSPRLLELSGIGGKELLSKAGIETVVDNPNVGENLQDHLMAGLSFEVIDSIPTADPLMRREPDALKDAQAQYAAKKGPLCVGGIGSHAYVPLLGADGASRQKELWSRAGEAATPHEGLVRRVLEKGGDGSGALFLFPGQGVTHENEPTDDHGPIYQPGSFASIGCIQTHPLSTGRSHIPTDSPLSGKPIIDPGYFSHPLDLELMAYHLLDCVRVREAEPLASCFVPGGKRNHARAFVESLEDAKTYLVQSAKTTYHYCGTCSMRPRDKGGVVDSRLVVWGTSNLRVVDASIFPLISRGNTMSTVYAVAEKAADLIKQGTKGA